MSRPVTHLAASVLGIGYLRPAPGTWGSLAAVVAGYGIASAGGAWAFAAALVAAVAVAFWSIGRIVAEAGPGIGVHDPAWIVIDEVAGQWIALLPVVVGAQANGAAPSALWPGWVAAFVLFRLFDVWKPGPVGWADRQPGVTGVVLDDLMAGVLAALGVVVLAGLAHGVLLR